MGASIQMSKTSQLGLPTSLANLACKTMCTGHVLYYHMTCDGIMLYIQYYNMIHHLLYHTPYLINKINQIKQELHILSPFGILDSFWSKIAETGFFLKYLIWPIRSPYILTSQRKSKKLLEQIWKKR